MIKTILLISYLALLSGQNMGQTYIPKTEDSAPKKMELERICCCDDPRKYVLQEEEWVPERRLGDDYSGGTDDGSNSKVPFVKKKFSREDDRVEVLEKGKNVLKDYRRFLSH
jgi:hypothetical protein